MFLLCCNHSDATLADTPNIDGYKGLCNGAGPIFILQLSDFTSSAGGFPPPLLCNGSDMVHDTMPKKEAGTVHLIGYPNHYLSSHILPQFCILVSP